MARRRRAIEGENGAAIDDAVSISARASVIDLEHMLARRRAVRNKCACRNTVARCTACLRIQFSIRRIPNHRAGQIDQGQRRRGIDPRLRLGSDAATLIDGRKGLSQCA